MLFYGKWRLVLVCLELSFKFISLYSYQNSFYHITAHHSFIHKFHSDIYTNLPFRWLWNFWHRCPHWNLGNSSRTIIPRVCPFPSQWNLSLCHFQLATRLLSTVSTDRTHCALSKLKIYFRLFQYSSFLLLIFVGETSLLFCGYFFREELTTG